MEFNINDKTNLVGMAALMAGENSKNIQDLERQIITGTDIKAEEEEYTRQYTEQMDHLSKTFDFNKFTHTTDTNIVEEKSAYPSDNSLFDIMSTSSESDVTALPSISQTIQEPSVSTVSRPIEDSQLRYMTLEQKKQTHVDSVLKDIVTKRDTEIEFDVDKETEEDDKNSLLEEIDTLRTSLEDDGIQIKHIPIVTKDSNLRDIQNVHKILMLKADRNRYCSFAEEIILSASHGMEYLFDGETDWFGRRPNLVGWSNTVRSKLRRCRFHTSTFVKDIMQEYNFSSGTRLLLELLPSMFLFSRQKRLAQSQQSESEFNRSVADLNKTMDF